MKIACGMRISTFNVPIRANQRQKMSDLDLLYYILTFISSKEADIFRLIKDYLFTYGATAILRRASRARQPNFRKRDMRKSVK